MATEPPCAGISEAADGHAAPGAWATSCLADTGCPATVAALGGKPLAHILIVAGASHDYTRQRSRDGDQDADSAPSKDYYAASLRMCMGMGGSEHAPGIAPNPGAARYLGTYVVLVPHQTLSS